MIYPSSDNRLKYIWLTRIGKNGKIIMYNKRTVLPLHIMKEVVYSLEKEQIHNSEEAI